ncbi:hypothetical protein SEA_SANASANA_65 [Microbacterium phage SanaSana]|uniref:hypothetical protein n=1 Tax=Microbacterium phage Stoor TaxID=2829393 RepID=UPI001BF03F57|nr:hypothetical protein QDW21_gp63 [Microbacterium phage Stoor]QUE26103.1 hypothetical protein SEA_STOOR_63 [Microbacterium phage Stoor]
MASITSIIKRKPAAPLVDQLDSKSEELSVSAADEAANAALYAKLAAEATQASDKANKQAIAVDQARTILLNAGVTL